MTKSILDLRMFPYRSLGPRDFRLLMALVAGVSALGALRFVVLGAWPVVFFLLLDVGLIYGAFRLNYRAARQYERLTLDASALTVRRVSAAGVERRSSFNPYWVRVVLTPGRFEQNHLSLRSHGRQEPIATFLSPAERIGLRDEIERGLAQVRNQRSESMSSNP